MTQPVGLFVSGPQAVRVGDRYWSKAGLVCRQPRDANQQRVGALPQQRRRYQLITGSIPGSRERFDEARVTHQQAAVEINRPRHIQVSEHQRRGLACICALPAQPVPDHAVEIGPKHYGDRDKGVGTESAQPSGDMLHATGLRVHAVHAATGAPAHEMLRITSASTYWLAPKAHTTSPLRRF
jgi:hypothetical protein